MTIKANTDLTNDTKDERRYQIKIRIYSFIAQFIALLNYFVNSTAVSEDRGDQNKNISNNKSDQLDE